MKKTKKTILISSGTFEMGGVEKVLVEYLNLIDLDRYKVILFMDSDLGELNVLEKEVPANIKIIYLKSKKTALKILPFKNRKRNFLDKIRYERLKTLERREKKRKFFEEYNKIEEVDLIIDFDYGLSKIISGIKNVQKIVWIHSYLPKLIKSKKKLEKNIKKLDQYDKIIAICKEMQEELEKIAPNVKNKMEFIYNPFDIDRIIRKSNEYSELSSSEKYLIEQEYFLSVSRLDLKSKDYETLIEGYAILKNSGRKEKLYIIGEGTGRGEIEAIIKSKKLEGEILLLGQKENPYVWMKNAKTFIHSSKFEGLPTVLLEALMLNKIIISSSCPTGPKEILSNPTSGLLFEVGNPVELADRVKEVLLNQNTKNEILKNIKIKIKSFESKNVIQKFYSVIEDTIKDYT